MRAAFINKFARGAKIDGNLTSRKADEADCSPCRLGVKCRP
jgi:hypothetical protein